MLHGRQGEEMIHINMREKIAYWAKRAGFAALATALLPVYLTVYGVIGLIGGAAAFVDDLRSVAEREDA